MFLFFTGISLEDGLPFSTNISSRTNDITFPVSCNGRCLETSSRSSILECKCDNECMFLGDCCYDYLVECDPRNLDLRTAHQEQISAFHQFDYYSNCVDIWGEDDSNKSSKVVNFCPLPHDTDNALKCRYGQRKTTISYHMPVENNGVLFLNMFCAACHGLPLHQLKLVADYNFECDTTIRDTKFPWKSFFNIFHCTRTVTVKPSFQVSRHRYQDVCHLCHHWWQLLSEQLCSTDYCKNKCSAYSNASSYSIHQRHFNIGACSKWLCDGNQRSPFKPVPTFFDFTGPKTPPLTIRDYQHSTSLVAKCQPGFEIHDNTCMSLATAQACYPPHENRHHTDYRVANLFGTTLIVHFQQNVLANSKLSATQNVILKQARDCNNLPPLYDKILPTDLPQSYQCVILYFDPMAFANFSQDLGVYKVAKDIFPGENLLRTMLLNHDPISNISCSGDIKLKSMTPHQDVIDGVVHIRSMESKQLFASNKDPMVISVLEDGSGIDILAFECQPHVGNKTCSERLQQETLSPIESCLKYELAYDSNNHNDIILLKTGRTLKKDEYILTEHGTILMCVDLYLESHKEENIWLIFESIAYTVSLLCLLTTFMIYCRYPALRTLPGLMLMNLITALFFAQLLFLLNRWGLFQALPTLCQIVASAQHYFWLASFAWMACMSMDVFHCLANGCTTVNVYTKPKYIKYVFVGWLLPVPFPAITNVLTKVTVSTLAYDTSVSCWLATHQGILYLFAIPVLTVVFGNILLFIGSVCRLSILLKNASFVGRKKDNQQRLAQCIKLSSWMGVSWIFGIIPNFVRVEFLWHLFVASNALQGVHIFLAFGITGRARVLMKAGPKPNLMSLKTSSAISTVANSVSFERRSGCS